MKRNVVANGASFFFFFFFFPLELPRLDYEGRREDAAFTLNFTLRTTLQIQIPQACLPVRTQAASSRWRPCTTYAASHLAHACCSALVVRGVMTHNFLQADPASSLHSHTSSEHHFQCDYFKASVGLYG